jgi:hypothetical protein
LLLLLLLLLDQQSLTGWGIPDGAGATFLSKYGTRVLSSQDLYN